MKLYLKGEKCYKPSCPIEKRGTNPPGQHGPNARRKPIGYGEQLREKQRVKMYIADTNVFGIDLNPVAVELAEVSLWLNAIFDGAHVPWFGMQLRAGNSLIGCRRDVFSAALLSPGRGDKDKPERDWRCAIPLRTVSALHSSANRTTGQAEARRAQTF